LSFAHRPRTRVKPPPAADTAHTPTMLDNGAGKLAWKDDGHFSYIRRGMYLNKDRHLTIFI
jgi:hypothetical protein